MKKKPAKPQKSAAKQKKKQADPIEAAIEKAFGSFLSKLGLDQEPAIIPPPRPAPRPPVPKNGRAPSRQELDRAENQLFAPLTPTGPVPDTSDAQDWGNVNQTDNGAPMSADNVSAMLHTQRTMLEVMANKYKRLESRMDGLESMLKASGMGRGMSTGGM